MREQNNSENTWLDAAYSVLTEQGIAAVKVQSLAKRTELTRTGFYWHFSDIDQLLEKIVLRWEEKNTGNLVERTTAYAETITEAMLNVFDCWLQPHLFDAALDVSIREWARNDDKLKVRLDQADAARLNAITNMFQRFGYSDEQAKIRSQTAMYTQAGYFALDVEIEWQERIESCAHYCEVFTGKKPRKNEFARFKAKHLTREQSVQKFSKLMHS